MHTMSNLTVVNAILNPIKTLMKHEDCVRPPFQFRAWFGPRSGLNHSRLDWGPVRMAESLSKPNQGCFAQHWCLCLDFIWKTRSQGAWLPSSWDRCCWFLPLTCIKIHTGFCKKKKMMLLKNKQGTNVRYTASNSFTPYSRLEERLAEDVIVFIYF